MPLGSGGGSKAIGPHAHIDSCASGTVWQGEKGREGGHHHKQGMLQRA
jgi:hypothetical protein